MSKQRIIVILGPTSSGKSEMAVRLAQKFKGEIISADSRQVYKGMNLGTGKVTRKEMKNIPHYLLDVASPKRRFTVVQYKNLALKSISKILKKNKIPIICGGTGFYIQALVDGLIFPKVKPDWKLRKKLEKKTINELLKRLKELDRERAKTIEKKNKRRLIRAIEIVMKTKSPIPSLKKSPIPCDVLMIGIRKEKEEIKKLIKRRLKKRFNKGMVAEIKKLHRQGISWKRLEEFGLEYRWITRFLQKKISYNQMFENLQKEIEHFSNRQMTWFKKDKRIKWVKRYKEAENLTQKFLK